MRSRLNPSWCRFVSGCCLLLVGLSCQFGVTPAVPQNVLLIVVDTLRQDHLPCYGYPRDTAPTLCGLASQGAHLDAVSPTGWTKPAVASLLTGLHPLRHQAIGRKDRLPAAATTLAEIFSSRGFHTLGVSASGWIGDKFGFAQGFDELLGVPVPSPQTPPTGAHLNAVLFPALERLEAPFFLYVHYIDPHDPYDPRMAWDASPLEPHLGERAPLRAGAVAASAGAGGRELVQAAIDLYDGEIRSVDGDIGRLLERMDTLGLMRGTLTLVTADHGEEFQEHGRAGHGHSLYREVTRVPLILHAPAVIEPRPEMGAAVLMDVVPTVLELLALVDPGLEEPALGGANLGRFDGTSFAEWLMGRGRAPVGEEEAGATAVGGRRGRIERLLHLDLDGRAGLAALAGERKVVLASLPYAKELFDLSRDAGEQRDLAGLDEESRRFNHLAGDLAARYNELSARALGRQKTELHQDLEGLRALGYLDGGGEESVDRTLPRRIRPADTPPGGLLGWERPSRFTSCVDTAEPRFAIQLLDGWHAPQLRFGGRWTRKEASLVLAPPGSWSAVATLEISGHRESAATVEVFVDGDPVSSRPVGGGAWTINVAIEPPPDKPPFLRIRLVCDSLVANEGIQDPRLRGVFIHSVCLTTGTMPR